MRRTNAGEFGSLIAAASKSTDEFKNDVEAIQAPMVKAALVAQKARDDEAIQRQILAVLEQARMIRDEKVTAIRSFRKAVDAEKKQLERLDKAEAFGTSKGDFRPLLHVLGCRNIEGFDGSQWE